MFFGGPARLVSNRTVADNAIRDRDFDIVARQDARTAQTDMRNDASLPRIENNVVARLVGRVHDNRHAGEKVRQRVARREAQCQADDTGRRDPCRDIDIPRQEQEVNGQHEQHDLRDILDQREHAGLDELVAAVSPRRLHENVGKLAQHVVPDHDGNGLEDTEGDELGSGRQVDVLRGESEAQQHERHEDRLMNESDQPVIEIRLRATGDF